MKFFITITQRNSNFNKKSAEEFNLGKESDGNRKDIFSKGYKITDFIKEYKVIENESFKLKLEKKDGEYFQLNIPNMRILQCLTNKGELIEIAFSNNLIDDLKLAINLKYDTTRFYFYLTDKIEFINPISFVYIDKKEFPQELLL